MQRCMGPTHTMYLFDFATRLKQLNPRLYIDTRRANPTGQEWANTGIYYREPGRKDIGISRANTAYAKDGGQKFLLDKADGKIDRFICGVSLNWVPEYDIYQEKDVTLDLVAPGWRGILMRLSKRGYFTLERARRVFRCKGLGEQPYDRMSFERRRELAAQEMLNGSRYTVRV